MSEFNAKQLENCRESLGHSQASFARKLNTPYSTYRDWEEGNSRIPGVVEVAVKLLMERDRWATQKAVDKAMEKFDRDHPNGIISEREEGE